MKLFIKNNKGITLPEVLVAGILSAIVSVVIVSVFFMHVNHVNNSIANSKMQTYFTRISEEIAANIRKANAALGYNEVWSNSITFEDKNSDRLFLYDNNGAVFAGYQITNSKILEWEKESATWKNIKIGNNVLQLSPESSFHLGGNRKSVTLSLKIITNYKKADYQLAAIEESYICRN